MVVAVVVLDTVVVVAVELCCLSDVSTVGFMILLVRWAWNSPSHGGLQHLQCRQAASSIVQAMLHTVLPSDKMLQISVSGVAMQLAQGIHGPNSTSIPVASFKQWLYVFEQNG